MPKQQDSESKLRQALESWADGKFSAPPPMELVELLRAEARRAIGACLASGNAGQPIPPKLIEAHLLAAIGQDAPPKPLRDLVKSVVDDLLVRDEPAEITRMLWSWKTGDLSVESELFAAIYSHLSCMAAKKLSAQQRLRNELDPRELLHEFYMRLRKAEISHLWANRRQFYAMAGTALDNVILDIHKAAGRGKRPDNRLRTTIGTAQHPASPATSVDFYVCREALQKLAQIDARQKEVVELRWLHGESVDEVAKTLNLSPMTVKRDYAKGIANLRNLLGFES